MQNAEELADASWRYAMMCRWSSSVASKQSVSRCVENLPPPAWIMQPPPDWQTHAERDYFTLRERLMLCKNGGRASILMSSADRVAARWATHAIIVSNTHALSAVTLNAKSNKTEAIQFTMLLGFCLTFSAARHKFWLHRQFSSAQFQRAMMGDGFNFGATAAGLFEQ